MFLTIYPSLINEIKVLVLPESMQIPLTNPDPKRDV